MGAMPDRVGDVVTMALRQRLAFGILLSNQQPAIPLSMKPSRLLPAVLFAVSTWALALDVVQPPFAPRVRRPAMAAAGDADAIVLLERALAVQRANPLDISAPAAVLGQLALRQDRIEYALRSYGDVRAALPGFYPPGHRVYARIDARIAEVYLAQGKYAEAESLLQHALDDETAQPVARAIVDEPAGALLTRARILTQLGTIELRRHRLEQVYRHLQRETDAAAVDAWLKGQG